MFSRSIIEDSRNIIEDSRSIIEDSRSINATSGVIRMTIVSDAPSCGDSRGVIYDCNIFILIQTTVGTVWLRNTRLDFLVCCGLYYKTLRICNVQQMDRFCNKPVPCIIDHKHINFDKHTSLLWNLYSALIVQAPCRLLGI
jgi:hypothetical protein